MPFYVGPPKGPETFRLGNRPPLTGIRAVALIPVLVFHSNFSTMPGAWVSLQVFFVLSGFLITSMLINEGQRNGRISLKSFYARRAVRLLPPMFLVTGLLAIYATFVNVGDAVHRIWGDILAALFYYYDYRSAFGKNPFFGFLGPCWSLSVEEQFYILWSLLMVFVIYLNRYRIGYVLALVGIIFSVADRFYLVHRVADFTPATFARVYYSFDGRADALFVGCLLGLLATDGYFSNWRNWAKRALTISAALSGVFLVWILFSAPLQQLRLVVWWLPLTTMASAIVLVYFTIIPKGLGSKFVGLAPFVFIGNLSYTVYLVHFPVYLALWPSTTHLSYWPNFALRLAVIFSIATASWLLVEKPLADWRRRSASK
jgi:peptidoglycan/LPS O-acetylase OafA/YrhL